MNGSEKYSETEENARERQKRTTMSSDGLTNDDPAASTVIGNGSDENKTKNPSKSTRSDGKIELKDDECWDKLGYSFPTWKKWTILRLDDHLQTDICS